MASIQTTIRLNDQVSSVLNNIIASVNLAVAQMYDMQQAMSADFDTSSLEAARESINEATVALNNMNDAMNQAMPDIPAPSQPPAPSPPETSSETTSRREPVPVPVQWQTDTLDVFTGSGIERFQQEVQSANDMLEQLNVTQSQIAQQAAATDVLSPEAVKDLNTLGTRMDWIRNRIQMIENNPLNVGTDQANAELERLRGQLDRMIQQQNDLNDAMDRMNVGDINESYLRLSSTINASEQHIRDNTDEQGRFNQEIQNSSASADELMNTIKRAVAAYVSIQSVGKVLSISDELVQTRSRLEMMNDGLQSTEELMNTVYASAQDARGSFADMASVVARFGNNAKDAFSSSEEVVAFANLVQKQMTIAGASTQEAANAELQLSQALGSGVLRGDELNSIFEQAPNLIQNIADYLNVPIGQIRTMASEGQLSAAVVKAAIFAAADDINSKFDSMHMTWGQMAQQMRNTALMAFHPVLQKLNDIGNSEDFQNLSTKAIDAIATVANIALEGIDLMTAGGQMIADNWSWIAPIVYGVAGALAAYNGYLIVTKGLEMASTGIKIALCMAEYAHAAATGATVAATTAQTAAQYGLNTALLACPLTWIILLIMALIAAFYAAVGAVNKFAGTSISATGLIGAAFAVLGSRMVNTFVVPVWNGFSALANFFGNVFNNPVAAVKVLFYDMCLTVLGYIQNLAHAIEALLNKIPGVTVDITSGLDNFYSGLEKAQQAVKDESGWTEYVEKMDYIDYRDAASAGYSFGEGVRDKVSGLFGKVSLPNVEDYTSGFQDAIAAGIGGDLGTISDDTGKIKDSLDITEEDLKYLRDIAEQETVNRFTTAEVTINQTNHNNISSEMDLDGVMSGMTDAVNEAIEITTEGVHT